jgi:hypothetical protein
MFTKTRFLMVATLAGGIGCTGKASEPVADPLAHATALYVRPVGFDGPFAMEIGDALPFEAIPIDETGARIGTAVTALWHSSDTTIASVTSDGVVHSLCMGTTTVTATKNLADKQVIGTRSVTVATTGPRCVTP